MARANFILPELGTGRRRNVEVADHRNARVLFAKNEIALVGISSHSLDS